MTGVLVDEGAGIGVGVEAVTDLRGGESGDERVDELPMDGLVDKDPICGDAHLA